MLILIMVFTVQLLIKASDCILNEVYNYNAYRLPELGLYKLCLYKVIL